MANSSSSPLVHLSAGAASGLSTCVILQPLDVENRECNNRNGSGEQYTFGRLSNLCGRPVTLSTGGARGQLSLEMCQEMHCLSDGMVNLIGGSASRAFAGALLMPFTVMKTRFESSKYNYTGVWNASRHILSQEGIRGLFTGLVATTLRDAPYAGIYVYFYEMYKKALRTPLEGWSSQSINLMAGGMGGLSATLITQPFDMIKTRMQLQPQEYTSIWRSLAKVTTEEGLGAYFSGMLPRLVRKPLQSMIAWSVYEEACRRMQKS